MSWAERTACRATVAPIGSVASQVISLGATANAGDVVVVALAVGGNNTTASASGLGATWTVAKRVSTNSPTLVIFVGTGITAPGTAVTLNNLGSTTMSAVATAYTGLTDSPSVVGSSGSATSANTASLTTSAVSATAGNLLVGAASHNGTVVNEINAPTWSSGDTNTRPGATSNGSTSPTRCSALDFITPAASASITAQYTFTASNTANIAIVELIPLPPGATGATGSLTLGGTAAGPVSGGGSLTLGASALAPVMANGSLTLGSPAAEAQPVYLASFTVDVGQEASDIPTLPADIPTGDYVGNDGSDLVDYPDPVLDAWGRPIAS